MKKIGILLLVIVMCLGLCACGEKTTIVEITEDNWTKYFELSSESNELVIIRTDKNAFDEIERIYALDSFVLKDGYTLGKDGFELKIGVDAYCTKHEYELDFEKNKVLLVKLIDEGNPDDVISTTGTVTDESPEFGYYTEICPETNFERTYKQTITRIEGTLSLVKE